MLLLGFECLVVDDFVLAARAATSGAGGSVFRPESARLGPLEPDLAGAVTILYSFTIPQRAEGLINRPIRSAAASSWLCGHGPAPVPLTGTPF